MGTKRKNKNKNKNKETTTKTRKKPKKKTKKKLNKNKNKTKEKEKQLTDDDGQSLHFLLINFIFSVVSFLFFSFFNSILFLFNDNDIISRVAFVNDE